MCRSSERHSLLILPPTTFSLYTHNEKEIIPSVIRADEKLHRRINKKTASKRFVSSLDLYDNFFLSPYPSHSVDSGIPDA